METKVKFRGRELLLRPDGAQGSASISLERLPDEDAETALLLAHQFMSALAWADGQPIREHTVCIAGFPVQVSKPLAGSVSTAIDTDYLPDPSDPKARLALAFYREALAANSIPYQFLGFYKVINIKASTREKQEEYIRQMLPLLTSHRARRRLDELKNIKEIKDDVAHYLYVSGRCAIAHSFNDPIVDPDKAGDVNRLRADLPLIRALAEWIIENDFEVKSRQTVRSEHLYELSGFRTLFGPELSDRMRLRSPLSLSDVPKLPNLSIRLRGKDRFTSDCTMKLR